MSVKSKKSAAAFAEPVQYALVTAGQVSHSRRSYIDFLEFDDDDLDFIEQVATGIADRSEEYVYDEEDMSVCSQATVSLNEPDKCDGDNSNGSHTISVGQTLPIDDLDEELPDMDVDRELNLGWDSDEELSLYEPEDDDLAMESESSTDDLLLLDDSLLFEPGKQDASIFAYDSEEEFFDVDDDDAESETRERSDLGEIQLSDRLTREERARQVAIRVGVSYGWERSGIALLAEIFEEHGWGQARVAIEQLLSEGITEDELLLVKELKDLWEDNHEYALAFFRSSFRTGYCAYEGGRVLSWRMAARVSQLFPNSDICEVESFLNAAFDAWYEGSNLRRRFPVFLNFLKHVTSWLDPWQCFPGGAFHDVLALEDFDLESERDLPRTLLYRELADFGLLPVWESDFLSSVGGAGGTRA